jgi:hypothetical protein
MAKIWVPSYQRDGKKVKGYWRDVSDQKQLAQRYKQGAEDRTQAPSLRAVSQRLRNANKFLFMQGGSKKDVFKKAMLRLSGQKMTFQRTAK